MIGGEEIPSFSRWPTFQIEFRRFINFPKNTNNRKWEMAMEMEMAADSTGSDNIGHG